MMDMNLLANISEICVYVGFASFAITIVSIFIGTLCVILQHI